MTNRLRLKYSVVYIDVIGFKFAVCHLLNVHSISDRNWFKSEKLVVEGTRVFMKCMCHLSVRAAP